jgi:uncharacterized protein
MFKRRELLKFGVGFFPVASHLKIGRRNKKNSFAGSASPRILRYNKLGNTDLEVSDVGFGVAVSTDPLLLVEAYRRGVNYFDVSPFYSWSIDMLSAAFSADAKMKKNVIIASKIECPNFFFRFTSRPMHKVLEECFDKTLQKLGRDHVDILQIHSVGENGLEDLDWLNEGTKIGAEVARLYENLKKKGKIRYTGVSSHGPLLLERAMRATIDTGKFDMIMPALNFMFTPKLKQLLMLAESKGVGIIAMKVLANAKAMEIIPEGGNPFSKAAIAWALDQPGVNGAVITIPDKKTLDEYLSASGGKLSYLDRTKLAVLRTMTNNNYCRVGCGECMAACPYGVEVPTILRIDQYRTDYKLPELAAYKYKGLSEYKKPLPCEFCEGDRCRGVCPFGIDIRQRLLTAQHALNRLADGETV